MPPHEHADVGLRDAAAWDEEEGEPRETPAPGTPTPAKMPAGGEHPEEAGFGQLRDQLPAIREGAVRATADAAAPQDPEPAESGATSEADDFVPVPASIVVHCIEKAERLDLPAIIVHPEYETAEYVPVTLKREHDLQWVARFCWREVLQRSPPKKLTAWMLCRSEGEQTSILKGGDTTVFSHLHDLPETAIVTVVIGRLSDLSTFEAALPIS